MAYSNTNLPSASKLPKVNVIPNLIGLKKTSIDCHRGKNKTQIRFFFQGRLMLYPFPVKIKPESKINFPSMEPYNYQNWRASSNSEKTIFCQQSSSKRATLKYFNLCSRYIRRFKWICLIEHLGMIIGIQYFKFYLLISCRKLRKKEQIIIKFVIIRLVLCLVS